MKWKWEIDGQVIEAVHSQGALKGKTTVTVDGQEIEVTKKGFWKLSLKGGEADLTLKPNPFVPSAKLLLGDSAVETTESPPGLPIWAWFFALACIAIPIAAMGGAISGGLGAGGMAGCLTVARGEGSVATRVGICVAITAGVWAAFYALIVAVS